MPVSRQVLDWKSGGTRAGIGLGASWATTTLGNGLGSASAGNFTAGARASHDFGGFYLSGAAAYGFHAMNTTRAAFGETYRATFNAHSLAGRVEAGARVSTAFADLLPYVALQGTALFTPAYAETGSGAGAFALSYGARTTTDARTELGLRLSRSSTDETGRTTLSAKAAWAYGFGSGPAATAGFTALPGTSFTTIGARTAAHTALVSLGFERGWNSGLAASLSLDGQFGRATTSLGAKARISLKW